MDHGGASVLLMSGHATDGQALVELRAGWSFLQKPFSKRTLLEAVDAMLGSQA